MTETIAVPNLADTPAWSGGVPLSLGWNRVTVEEAEAGKSSGGHPQVAFKFASSDGGGIRDWLTFAPKAMGRVKLALDALGVNTSVEFNLNPAALIGRACDIYITEEADRNDPDVKRKRVTSYRRADGSAPEADPITSGDPLAASTAGSSNDDIPF